MRLNFQFDQPRHVGLYAAGQVRMPLEGDVVGQEAELLQVLVHHRSLEVLSHVGQVDPGLLQVQILKNKMVILLKSFTLMIKGSSSKKY